MRSNESVRPVKNQYFGDINDYRKYGILRCARTAGWQVGVCWMLTPDDGRSDGEKIDYLSKPTRWERHDSELFHELAETLSRHDGRHIRHAGQDSVLPGVHHFSDHVPDSRDARRIWFDSAMQALASADLVFFDPDNGLEIQSKRYGSKDSSKYLFWDEIEETWRRQSSILVFQHFPREKRSEFTPRMMAALAAHTPGSTVVGLTTSHVLFLFAAQEEHKDRLGKFLSELKANWTGEIAAWCSVSDALSTRAHVSERDDN